MHFAEDLYAARLSRDESRLAYWNAVFASEHREAVRQTLIQALHGSKESIATANLVWLLSIAGLRSQHEYDELVRQLNDKTPKTSIAFLRVLEHQNLDPFWNSSFPFVILAERSANYDLKLRLVDFLLSQKANDPFTIYFFAKLLRNRDYELSEGAREGLNRIYSELHPLCPSRRFISKIFSAKTLTQYNRSLRHYFLRLTYSLPNDPNPIHRYSRVWRTYLRRGR